MRTLLSVGTRPGLTVTGGGPSVDANGAGLFLRTMTITSFPITIFRYGSVKRSAAPNAYTSVGSITGSDNNAAFFIAETGSNNRWFVRGVNGGGFTSREYSAFATSDSPIVALCAVYKSASEIDVYYDGILDNGTLLTGSGEPNYNRFSPDGAYRGSGNLYAKADNDTALAAVWGRALSPVEVALLSSNPYRIFKPMPRRIWAHSAAAGAAALQGAATDTATATGALTTAIPVLGAAVSVGAASGALATAIQISGAAASVSSASGIITAQITMAASAIAAAASSAALTTAIPIEGSAVGFSAATGNVTAQIVLSGAALAQALSTGSLGGGTAELSGLAAVLAASVGSLTTQIPLSGAAASASAGTGNITTLIRLDAVAASLSTATGDLAVAITMSAAALAQAVAGGTLTAQIRLNGNAVAQALAVAALTGGALAVTGQVAVSDKINASVLISDRHNHRATVYDLQ